MAFGVEVGIKLSDYYSQITNHEKFGLKKCVSLAILFDSTHDILKSSSNRQHENHEIVWKLRRD